MSYWKYSRISHNTNEFMGIKDKLLSIRALIYSHCFNCGYKEYEKFIVCPRCESTNVRSFTGHGSSSVLIAISENCEVRLDYYGNTLLFSDGDHTEYFHNINISDLPRILLDLSLRYNSTFSINNFLKDYLAKNFKVFL